MTQSLLVNSTHDRRNTIQSLSLTGRPNGGKIIQELERDKMELQELVQGLNEKLAQMEQKQKTLETKVEKLSTQQETMIAQQDKQYNNLLAVLSQKLLQDSERNIAQSLQVSHIGSQYGAIQQQFSPRQSIQTSQMHQFGSIQHASESMHEPMQQYHQQQMMSMQSMSGVSQQHQAPHTPLQQPMQHQTSFAHQPHIQSHGAPYNQAGQFDAQQDKSSVPGPNFNVAQNMDDTMQSDEHYYTQQESATS